MSTLIPSTDQVRSLPAYAERTVEADAVDENGHLNVGDYFRLSSHAVWHRMRDLGMAEDYIAARGHSFFVVEHRLRYLGELVPGQRFSVRVGLVGQTAKALHGAAFVLEEDADRVACAFEAVYVHVSMDSRRAATVPEDLASAFAEEISTHASWLGEVAQGLTLRR